MENVTSKNEILLIGKLENKDFSIQRMNDENLFKNNLLVERLSGTIDRIPIKIWASIFEKIPSETWKEKLLVRGSILSYSENGHSYITVLVSGAKKVTNQTSDENKVWIEGEIYDSSFRITPFGRKIIDIKLVSNRRNGKKSVIYSIAWGENAEELKTVEIGTKIFAEGRLQSRTYQKAVENGLFEEREINELSINTYTIL